MKNLIVRHTSSSVIVTTECKRQQTAINRFSKFLADYDSEFTKTMLKCFMSLSPVYNHDGVCGFKSKYWYKDYSCELLVHNNVYMLVLDFSETISEEETSSFESGLNDSDSDTSDFDSEDTKDTSEVTNDTTSETITFVLHVRKHSVVKPVRIFPRHCCPVICFPYGMPADYYPYKILVDGLRIWDCRSCVYNKYLADLIGAPPGGELPF